MGFECCPALFFEYRKQSGINKSLVVLVDQTNLIWPAITHITALLGPTLHVNSLFLLKSIQPPLDITAAYSYLAAPSIYSYPK